MSKFSQKMGGKEVGAAEKYAQPHTDSGKGLDMKTLGGGAFDYSDVKTTGITTRGNGAATKGTKARGPMG